MADEIKREIALIMEGPDAPSDVTGAEFDEWLHPYEEKRFPKYLEPRNNFEQWDSRR